MAKRNWVGDVESGCGAGEGKMAWRWWKIDVVENEEEGTRVSVEYSVEAVEVVISDVN